MLATIPAAICPTDGEAVAKPANVPARKNYLFSLADFGQGPESAWAQVVSRTAFRVNEHVDFGAISDGTSNTIAMAEKLIADDGGLDYRRNVIRSTNGNPVVSGAFSNSGPGNPSVCSSTRGSLYEYKQPYTPHAFTANEQFDHKVGRNYFEAKTSGFTTINPPNNPFCSNQAVTNNAVGTRVYMMAPTSLHTGGINALWSDGSVRFVSETVGAGDQGSRAVLPNNGPAGASSSNPSNYGVWGAMGTINCGESAAL